VKKWFRCWFVMGIILCSMILGGCGQHTRQSQPAPYSNDDEKATSVKDQAKDKVKDEATSETKAASDSTPMEKTSSVKKKVKVKGIYVSAWNMNGAKYDKLVKLVQDTDLNAMVIDVKNDSGQVTYPSNAAVVKEIGADGKNVVPDLQDKVAKLKEQGIYTIARLVVFKDPYLAGKKTSYAMQNKGGGVWRDGKGISWVDPYQEKVWDYNIAIAEEAAALGFDEIQFDYVRFPDNAKKVDSQVQYQNTKGYSKSEAIQKFLMRAKEKLPGVVISADVFGLTTSSKDDMGIGQKWDSIAPVVDVISPMIYPSHYSKGMYKVANPDLKPYDIVAKALEDGLAVNHSIGTSTNDSSPARIRPWLQDFTAKWVKPHQTYGNKQVKEQIKAGQDQGIDEFLLWNPSGQYSYH
jgi:hypothetical protein